MMKNELTKELADEINKVLENKANFCEHYVYEETLKPKIKMVLDDLEKNHDTSWSIEMYLRNKNNMKKDALKYRGRKISYEEMFNKSFEYAKSLKEMGFDETSEIPVCVSNIPEFVSLFLAINFIGAKMNIVGEWFNKEYLTNILNKTNSNYMFISDDIYKDIASSVTDSNIENIVMFSLTDSLLEDKDGEKIDPYEELDNKAYKFVNKIASYQVDSKKPIIVEKDFLELGKKYKGSVIADTTLDDVCTITYTSGTTNPGCPKGCIHPNRSYITLSRFKESDVSGMPNMRNLTVLAHIPTYTHMDLTCSISDTLYEKCTLAMEPIYSREFFPYSLLINKPNFVPASTGFWGHLCKLLNYDDKWKNINMPYLMIPTVTGEGCSQGEEKFFNYTSRNHKFGTAKLPFPLAPVTFSIGGGTSESSGIFVTLYKALQEKELNNLIHKNTLGLTPYKFTRIEVLDKEGKPCKIGEAGLLVANSPCNMIGYTDNSLNESIHVKDATGKDWLSLGTYSYKSDKHNRIKMKGRLNDDIYTASGAKVPFYKIEEEVLKDTKNIMSASLVEIEKGSSYVCHIEKQPRTKKEEEKILTSCATRLLKEIPEEVINKLYFKVRESFPLAPSGKRDTNLLKEEGIDSKCIPANEFVPEKPNNIVKKLIKK